LLKAVKCKNLEITQLLLEKGAKVSATDKVFIASDSGNMLFITLQKHIVGVKHYELFENRISK